MTAKANPPKVSHRICDECGHKQLVAADLAPDACPKCNKVYGRLRVGSRFAIPGGRQHGSTAPAPTGYRTRYARPDSMLRAARPTPCRVGLGLVERQVEQLELAEQVPLDAMAGEDTADGLLGLVERLDPDVAGHQHGVLRVDHRRRPPML